MLTGQLPGDAGVSRQQRGLYRPEFVATSRPVPRRTAARATDQLPAGLVQICRTALRPVPCSDSLSILRYVRRLHQAITIRSQRGVVD